jgi:DNA-binding response OmpR family regulator
MARLLLVEDDLAMARGLIALLVAQGFAVDHVISGGDAIEWAESDTYDLVLLDVGLPSMDGFEVLRTLRKRGFSVPVLMVTARDGIGDRVIGLDGGADDYLTKPFDHRELFARIRALLRRGAAEVSPMLEIDDLVCDPASQTAELAGVRLDLPRREWAVLYSLCRQAGKVISKERLHSEVFNFNEEAGPNAIEVYVTRLRKKLQPGGPVIKNFRGLGYMIEQLDGRRRE